MSESDFIAAVQAGCNAADLHLKCSYPSCACKQTPLIVLAATKQLAADHLAAIAAKDRQITDLAAKLREPHPDRDCLAEANTIIAAKDGEIATWKQRAETAEASERQTQELVNAKYWNQIRADNSNLNGLLRQKELEIEQLRTRILFAAGDDLCRLTQEEIKAYTSGEVQIPPKEEFLPSCERFWNQIAGAAGVLSGCLTLAQLIAENQALTARVEAMSHEGTTRNAEYDSLSRTVTALRKLLADVRGEVGNG